MAKFFAAVGLTGGGDANLDGIRITDNNVEENDICLAVDPSLKTFSAYLFKATGAPAEDSPDYILPDYSTGTTPYAGDGYWEVLDYQNFITITTTTT